MNKADKLGASASFAAAARPRSERRQMIAKATGEAPTAESAEPPRVVPLNDLAHNPYNPRADMGELQETAESLLGKGQIQPLTIVTRQAFLKAHPGQESALGSASYVVLDGNRRLAAARLAGLEELRVDVNDDLAGSGTDLLEAALVANLHRKDLTPLEEAETLAGLVQVQGSQREVARKIGKSHVWVSQRLALLELKPELKAQLAAGDLTVEEARRIGKLAVEEQIAAAQAATEARKAKASRARVKKARTTEASASPEPAAVPPSVNAVSTPVPVQMDWSDPTAIASVLCARLSPDQRRVLADLLLREG
ncbi:ParB/RepB/Spo0J family partition protein [Actinomadura nitritigenes]|uniref:ParB/RepB/Spo0J family partition protein n=1 Tax=Actinomadura nitritigenes TaxID=134602 RepID=UPI003D93E7EC